MPDPIGTDPISTDPIGTDPIGTDPISTDPFQKPPGRPTMRDVGALAGVSLKTVSRVINGEPNVDPALATRVRRAAAQLNYRHNLTASNLRRGDGKSFMVGLLLEDVANPYSSSVYRAVENIAQTRGVGVLAGSLDENPERERELAASLFARRVDGLIIVPAGRDQSYLRNDQLMGTAIVFVDRPPALLAADSVMADNRAGAAAGVRHLIDGGHRRIAFLGDLPSIMTAQQRYEGYQDSLRSAGLPEDPWLVRRGLHTESAAQAATASLLAGAAPPSALFSAQNVITIGVIRALCAAGLQHRIALAGFDDLPLADLLDPPVTVVAQDVTAIGALAAQILFRRIDGDTTEPRMHVVPTRLITRGSGEIPLDDT